MSYDEIFAMVFIIGCIVFFGTTWLSVVSHLCISDSECELAKNNAYVSSPAYFCEKQVNGKYVLEGKTDFCIIELDNNRLAQRKIVYYQSRYRLVNVGNFHIEEECKVSLAGRFPIRTCEDVIIYDE